MHLKRQKKKRDDENLIPLINIVFLMLIFFLAAGALRPFREDNVEPAEATFTQDGERPMGPVLISPDGQISVGGIEQDQDALKSLLQTRVASGNKSPLPVVADKNLDAEKLVDVIETAKAAGIKKIRLVTRKRSSQ